MKTLRTIWRSRLFAVVVSVVAVLISPVVAHASIALPTPDTTLPDANALPYGDFVIYSMAFLDFAYGGGTNGPQANTSFFVASGPGNIGAPKYPNDLVIATGPAGNAANLSPNADDAYFTPDGTNTDFFKFTGADPSPNAPNGFTGDALNSWDVRVTDLVSRLGNDDLVFWFNLNESGTENALTGQDLLAWVEVTLEGPGGSLVRTMNGNGSLTGPISDSNRTDWAYVHSEITVDPATLQFKHPGPLAAGEKQLGYKTLSQNLGANNAAFGGFNADLNTAIRTGLYDIMRVKMELGNVNNGYEQLFIRGADVGGDIPPIVPEPAAFVVWALLGMIGLCCHQWRRRT